MNHIKPLVLALTAISLAACSGGKKENPKLDYQSANNKIVSLEVPPDLNDPRNGDLYSLPKGTTANPNAMKETKSQGRKKVLNQVKDAYIERQGNQRWLVVKNKSAAEMWPLLRAFWQEAGFTIYSEEPQAGLMETEWAENRAKLPNQGLRKLFDKVGMGGVYTTSERDKFLIRMERNSHTGDLDIFFTHKGLEEVFDSKKEESTIWQPRANDPNLEAAFLSRFMQYLGVDEAVATQQTAVRADQAQGTEFAKLEQDSVIVYGAAERNVNRIAAALDRVGLTVQQFVSERGMFIVRPAPTQSEELAQAAADNRKAGLLSRWFKGKKDKQPVAASNQPAQLLVGLVQEPNGQRVVLLDQTGKPLNDARANKWIRDLYNELK
ncbi:outer membrane protein assembly factor BamC [uncultured Kingella sp.]|uniref:outer membrane protein assembly factor BamC n=1 Tax=Kingella oralis TaxID=505 RepID=UPI002597EDFB|nr:outer membrane protein assembly factor BamC [uncultured Kingella sp.]